MKNLKMEKCRGDFTADKICRGEGGRVELCVRAVCARVEEPHDLLLSLPARLLLAARPAAAGVWVCARDARDERALSERARRRI